MIIDQTCTQEKKVGKCRGYFLRYFYNSASKQCEEFIYGIGKLNQKIICKLFYRIKIKKKVDVMEMIIILKHWKLVLKNAQLKKNHLLSLNLIYALWNHKLEDVEVILKDTFTMLQANNVKALFMEVNEYKKNLNLSYLTLK